MIQPRTSDTESDRGASFGEAVSPPHAPRAISAVSLGEFFIPESTAPDGESIDATVFSTVGRRTREREAGAIAEENAERRAWIERGRTSPFIVEEG
ncbi:MAG: hypothetical protein ABEJ58_07715 [Halodesulfurarchaeum sp.]